MRSYFATLQSLTIPGGVPETSPRTYIGPASGFPAALVAAYVAAFYTPVGGRIDFWDDDSYRYEINLSAGGSAGVVAIGIVEGADIVELARHVFTAPSDFATLFGLGNIGGSTISPTMLFNGNCTVGIQRGADAFVDYGFANVPIGGEVAFDENTADSSTFITTETLVQTVTADLAGGRTYLIVADGSMGTTVADSRGVTRIRLGNGTGGTQLQERSVDLANPGATNSAGMPYYLAARYTPAVDAAAQVFSLTMQRGTGTGTLRQEAFTDRPAYLTVYLAR